MKRQQVRQAAERSAQESGEKVGTTVSKDTYDINFHYRHAGVANPATAQTCRNKPFANLVEFAMTNGIEVQPKCDKVGTHG